MFEICVSDHRNLETGRSSFPVSTQKAMEKVGYKKKRRKQDQMQTFKILLKSLIAKEQHYEGRNDKKYIYTLYIFTHTDTHRRYKYN